MAMICYFDNANIVEEALVKCKFFKNMPSWGCYDCCNETVCRKRKEEARLKEVQSHTEETTKTVKFKVFGHSGTIRLNNESEMVWISTERR
jgi:hypothetical protein